MIALRPWGISRRAEQQHPAFPSATKNRQRTQGTKRLPKEYLRRSELIDVEKIEGNSEGLYAHQEEYRRILACTQGQLGLGRLVVHMQLRFTSLVQLYQS